MKTHPAEKIHNDTDSTMNVAFPGGNTYGSGVNSTTEASRIKRRRRDLMAKKLHHRQTATVPVPWRRRFRRPDQMTMVIISRVMHKARA